jgi:hypothetical protein
MQCHPGWCVSFRFGFALEPFTRGLASEDADKQTQRFVAVIVQRLMTSRASRSPISLLSRPDHNAAAPCREVPSVATRGVHRGFFSGHHLIADRFGGPQARSSPSARQGRSEAKWLDRTATRGRSAAMTYETNVTRWSG